MLPLIQQQVGFSLQYCALCCVTVLDWHVPLFTLLCYCVGVMCCYVWIVFAVLL